MRLPILCFAIVSAAANAAPEQSFNEFTIRGTDVPEHAPAFERFPARDRSHGALVAPKVDADPRSRLFRTVIREDSKHGPNFAGHYRIVFWGCGFGCASLAIVDESTGHVDHPSNLRTVDDTNVADQELEPPDGRLVKFRLDSRLLVVIGGINEESARRGVSYFVWQGGVLTRILFVHRPYA